MKLQTKTVKKGYKKACQLIRYFDKRWLSLNELLDTAEAIEANLNRDVLWQRLRKGKCKTLEEFLEPKRAYKMTKTKETDEFQGCSKELIRIMKYGTNEELLNYQGGRIVKGGKSRVKKEKPEVKSKKVVK